MLSTSGIFRHVPGAPEGEFIVATETGISSRSSRRRRGPPGRGQAGMACLQVHEDDHPAEAPRLAAEMKVEVKVPPGPRARARADRAHGRDRLAGGFAVQRLPLL